MSLPPLAAPTTSFEEAQSASMSFKNRVYFAVLGAHWVLEVVFQRDPGELLRGADVRLAEWALVVAIWIAFRKPWPLRRLEIAIIAFWYALVGVNLVGVMRAPEENVFVFAQSICLGTLLGVVGCQLTARPALAGVVLAWAAPAVPLGLRLGRGALVPWAFFAVPSVVVFFAARSRERLARREHAARAALADANHKLREADAARSRLFVHLSHDLRTPLAIIRAEAQWLGGHGGDDAGPALRRIEANAVLVAELTSELLELAALDGGAAPCAKAPCDVGAIARDVAAQHEPPPGRGALVVAVAEPAPVADADPRHVRRILSNLVENAVRQAEGGPLDVRIGVAAEADAVTVAVSDGGPGIPADRRARLFERFAAFRPEGGLVGGVGLPLSRELAVRNGGALELDEAAPRTTFRLRLARSSAASATTGSATAPRFADRAPAPPVAGGGGPDVLVVEDNRDLRDLVARLLGGRFRVRVAASQAEALAELARAAPEAILCDVLLPDGDGYAILAHVRRQRELEGVPLVFLSALGSAAERTRGLAAGADDYLAKPFDAAELAARLDAVLRRAGARRAALRAQRDEVVAELHDGVASQLTRAAMLVRGARDGGDRLDGAAAAIDAAIVETRALMSLGDAGPLAWDDLVGALRAELSAPCEAAGVEAELVETTDGTCPFFTSIEAHTLRRVAREAATNVVKHAGARRLVARLEVRAGAAQLTVDDDGRGLPEAGAKGGRGLGILERRASRMGGRVRLGKSALGGVRVEASLPGAHAPAAA